MISCFKKVLIFIIVISSCFLSLLETSFAAEQGFLKGVVIGIDAGHQGKGNGQKESIAEPTPATPETPATPATQPPITEPIVTEPVIEKLIAQPVLSYSTVNNETVKLNIYTINGSSYINPKDFEYLLAATSKAFQMNWDETAAVYHITTGNTAAQDGFVISQNDGQLRETVLSKAMVQYDAKSSEILICNIDGNTYFKLTDFAQMIDIALKWNATQEALYVDSEIPYAQSDSITVEALNEATFWTNLYTLPNYDKQLLESYRQQHVAQPQMSAADLVKEVNVGTYRPFYTDTQTIQDPNAIDVMVNKYNMLPDGFVPQLADVPSKYGFRQKMHPEAVEHLVQFFDAASANGINMRAASAYRSFKRQTTLYKNYSARDGQVGADTYSARPGFSEHQTGLAVDVSLAGGSYSNIGYSPKYPWIRDNAHLYGFIVRYTVDGQPITGYQSEPWHIRYLGVDLATKIYQSGLTYEEYAATADKRTVAPAGEQVAVKSI